mmetsp:Transcript_10425/g.30607  ORF Transcript_10425/g.30607 Transcript_10425/m.30607 type:complete len:148 (+) Transcript_10425:116-559(+)
MKDFIQDAPFTGHWAHAIGGTVLLLYATFGVFLGWQIRLGNGAKTYPGAEETARERHPYIMSVVLLFLVFEIPDGLTLAAANEIPLLKSTHASTAVIVLLAMALVGALGLLGRGSKLGRDAHTYIGTFAAGVLLVHAYFGLALGWSL